MSGWNPWDGETDEDNIDGVGFEAKGSALRKATQSNPRVHPCPTCKEPNKLTPLDVRRGHQCNDCADLCESTGGKYGF